MSQMDPSSQEQKLPFLTEGICLALLPVLAYAVVYKLHEGLCSYYGLPAAIISLSVWNVIGLSIGLATVGVSAIVVFHLSRHLISGVKMPQPSLLVLRRFLLAKWMSFAIVVIILALTLGRVPFFSLLIFAVFAIDDFVIPLRSRNGTSFLESLKAHYDRKRMSPPGPLFRLTYRAWTNVLLVALLLFVSLHVMKSVGRYTAQSKTEYLVTTHNGTKYALLAAYDGLFYACSFEDGFLENEYRTFDPTTLVWSRERTGPLKRREEDS